MQELQVPLGLRSLYPRSLHPMGTVVDLWRDQASLNLDNPLNPDTTVVYLLPGRCRQSWASPPPFRVSSRARIMPRLGRGTASASLLFQDFFRPLVKSTRIIGGVIHNPIAHFTFPDLSKLIFDCEANSTMFVHLKTSNWRKVFLTVRGFKFDYFAINSTTALLWHV